MSEPSIIERSSLLLRDVTQKPVPQGLLFLTLSLGVSILVAWLGFAQTAHHDPIIGSLIWTGRLAFLIFLVPLFARPLRILFKSSFTATMMRWRRNAGICYGASQSVHLVIVCIMFATVPNPPTETVIVIVGATGLALSLAMLITSFPTPTKFVGPKYWRWIHKSGFHVFMFIYFFDFVVEPALLQHPTSHLFWALLTVAGMAVRTVVMFKRSPAARAA